MESYYKETTAIDSNGQKIITGFITSTGNGQLAHYVRVGVGSYELIKTTDATPAQDLRLVGKKLTLG